MIRSNILAFVRMKCQGSEWKEGHDYACTSACYLQGRACPVVYVCMCVCVSQVYIREQRDK